MHNPKTKILSSYLVQKDILKTIAAESIVI